MKPYPYMRYFDDNNAYPPPAGGGLIEAAVSITHVCLGMVSIPRPRAGASLKQQDCTKDEVIAWAVSPARGRGPH